MSTALYANCRDCQKPWSLRGDGGQVLPLVCPRCGELLTVWEESKTKVTATDVRKQLATLSNQIGSLYSYRVGTTGNQRRTISKRIADLTVQYLNLRATLKQESAS